MIELKSGSVQMFSLGNAEPFCDFNEVNGVIETEIEPYSISQEVLNLNNEMTFEAEMTYYSPTMLDSITSLNSRPFYIEYYIPIMVQARWHKNPRINKKWFKRYGMKEDKVLVRCGVESFTQNANYNPYDDTSCLTEHTEYSITLNNNLEYKFRPDQLRRNLKMEMCYG